MHPNPELESVHLLKTDSMTPVVPRNGVTQHEVSAEGETFHEIEPSIPESSADSIADFLRRAWPNLLEEMHADPRVTAWLRELGDKGADSFDRIAAVAGALHQRLIQSPTSCSVESLASQVRTDGLTVSSAEGSLALTLLLRAQLIDTNEDGTLRPIAVTRPLPPSGTQSDFALHYLQPITRKCQQPKKGVLDA